MPKQVNYKKTSPWHNTGTFGKYLDFWQARTIPAEKDDLTYTIQKVYEHRPDLLAYDLYGDSNLWWVFAMRNPNNIKDPIWDFIPGRRIYIPKQSNIERALGLS